MASGAVSNLRKEVHGRRALEHIERLSELGDRFVGQPGDVKAIDYISSWFESLGLRVERTDIEVPSFRQLACTITLPDGTEIPGIAPYFTPSTEGVVEARAVFVGEGEDQDYEGRDVRDKIVVLEETGLGYSKFWLGTFASRARNRGALALIVVHPMPWPYRMSAEAGYSDLNRRFEEPMIPAATISASGGLRLMEAIGRNEGPIRFNVQTVIEPVRSACIAGVLRGAVAPEERVVIMAHRDHGFAPGANDNGSGTGTMLELARVLSKERTERSVVFLSSTAEEGVTPGIAQYIEALGARTKDVKAVFDLDMFGVGGRLYLVDEGRWPDKAPMRHTPWLLGLLESVADELGYHLSRMTATWGVAESGRWIEAGVPAAWFWKPDDLYYHSPMDTPDKVDPNLLKVVGDITLEAVVRVANRKVNSGA